MTKPVTKQRTIAAPAKVAGFGYFSGKDVCAEFRPAPRHTGLVFVRRDLDPPIRIPARVEHRVSAPRRTTLCCLGATVEMVEHVLAALAGLAIDNCEIWVDRPEMPGCDGSALPFVEALVTAGVVEQDAARRKLPIHKPIRVEEKESWIEALPSESPGLTLAYELEYECTTAVGRQSLKLDIHPDTFQSELAPSRTFLLKSEADQLLAQGLGRRTTSADLLVFGPDGPIDNPLRFPDECVRHKVLDLVGDLALAGCDLEGLVVGHRSGHQLNAELVAAVLAEAGLASDLRCSA